MADITKIQPIGSSTQYELGARYLTTARTLTIGSTGKTFDGTANVSWSKAELLGSSSSSNFYRGDNTWSNTLAGSFFADTIVATNTTTNGAQFAMRFSDRNYNTYGLMWTSRIGNRGGRIGFRHYTENTSGTYNGYQENFYLPTPTSGRTSNISYNILTTKGNDEISDGFKIWTQYTGKSAYINSGSALEIREVNRVTSNQSSWDYAPKLGFHWGGRFQGVLGFNYSGEFYLEKSDGTGGTAVLHTGKTYGAVWNDYAEMRNVPEMQKEESILKPGMCVREVGDGTMVLSTSRLERGCKIISDTFGFNIGETDDCKTPIAVSGRVLVYLNEDREIAAQHIGWPVCSGPNGTVSIMTEEEEEKYSSRIVGTISEIPDYETWGSDNVLVDNRIWIYVR